jgi:hypothetical protein
LNNFANDQMSVQIVMKHVEPSLSSTDRQYDKPIDLQIHSRPGTINTIVIICNFDYRNRRRLVTICQLYRDRGHIGFSSMPVIVTSLVISMWSGTRMLLNIGSILYVFKTVAASTVLN